MKSSSFFCRLSGLAVVISLFPYLVSAQSTDMAYDESTKVVRAGIGLVATFTVGSVTVPPLQANYEQAVSDEISIGGIVGYASSTYSYPNYDYNYRSNTISKSMSSIDYSYLVVGVRGNYHLWTSEKFDPYGGVTLGYNKVSMADGGPQGAAGGLYSGIASSAMIFGGQVGANYYFNQRFGAWAEFGYGIGVLNLGVALKL